jgi:hypothetical protein
VGGTFSEGRMASSLTQNESSGAAGAELVLEVAAAGLLITSAHQAHP